MVNAKVYVFNKPKKLGVVIKSVAYGLSTTKVLIDWGNKKTWVDAFKLKTA